MRNLGLKIEGGRGVDSFFPTKEPTLSIDFIYYLRNRKRVACVYGVIMHAGNVGRIREKRVKPECFTLLEYSPNILREHCHTVTCATSFYSEQFYSNDRR